MCPPSEFIPLAEENGSILRIGEWVWRGPAPTPRRGRPRARVAVNISPVQFSHPDLPALVARFSPRPGSRGERLELELTESTLIANKARSLGRLAPAQSDGRDDRDRRFRDRLFVARHVAILSIRPDQARSLVRARNRKQPAGQGDLSRRRRARRQPRRDRPRRRGRNRGPGGIVEGQALRRGARLSLRPAARRSRLVASGVRSPRPANDRSPWRRTAIRRPHSPPRSPRYGAELFNAAQQRLRGDLVGNDHRRAQQPERAGQRVEFVEPTRHQNADRGGLQGGQGDRHRALVQRVIDQPALDIEEIVEDDRRRRRVREVLPDRRSEKLL